MNGQHNEKRGRVRMARVKAAETIRNNKLSAFGFFLITSLIIVTFPTSLSVIYLHNFISYIDQQTDEKRMQEQTEIEKMMNANHIDVYRLGNKITSNKRVRFYSIAKERDSQEEYEIKNYLAGFIGEKEIYSNCFIFFPQHDRIISYKQSSPKDNYISEIYSKYRNSLSQLLENPQDGDWVVVRADDREEKRLFYLKPITSNTGTNQQALFMVEIDLNYLKNRIDLYLSADDYCILAAQEEYLLCVGGEQTEEEYKEWFENYRDGAADMERHENAVRVLDSNALGMKILYFEVNQSAIRMYFKMFSYAGIEFICCILISGLLVLYFSRYHSGKIKEIEVALGREKKNSAIVPGGNEYDRIMGYIDSYHQEYLLLNAQSDKYKQACQNLYMRNMLSGNIRDKSSVRETLQLYDIDMPGEYFKIIVFYEALGEEEENLDSVQNDEAEIRVLEEAINAEVYLWVSNKDRIYTLQISGRYVCVLNFENCDMKNDNSINEVAESIQQILRSFGISNYQYKENDGYCSLEEISETYGKLIQAITVETKIDKNEGNIVEYVAQCLEIIKCQYSDKMLSTDGIAAQLQVSRSYLSSLFKQQIGIGLLDYIHRYRINEFKKEIQKNPNIRLHEAAERAGFGNQAALIRVFKKIEGVTPGQYRDELLQKAENDRKQKV